jgi:hypothetical protein
MTKRLLIGTLFLHALMLQIMTAEAADIRPFISNSGSYREIIIEGTIEHGDFDTFVRIAKENQGRVSGVHIFSPGGDFNEAMKIGRVMRALELSSQAPMKSQSGQPNCEDMLGIRPNDPKNCTCASAGFFIHVGSIHRGGTYLAVHRPYFSKGKFGELSQAEAQRTFDALQENARAYLQEMGVPKHIQEDILGTPSDRTLILDEKTIKTYFWLDIPYRHEWKKNRCSILSESENQRSEDFSRRILRARNASEADLSRQEWEDLSTLQKKQTEERKCAIEINQKSRIDAYARYFGAQVNDYDEQNFLKWSTAAKYLGRQFYEILSEERFVEEKLSGVSFLSRAATANAPLLVLSDTRGRPKIVGGVSVASTPNPSLEYSKRLLQSLESEWGQRSGGNGTTEWVWDKVGFSAQLTYESVSAEGPHLRLVIDYK